MNIPAILEKAELFQGLTPDEIKNIAEMCQDKTFKKEEEVFVEGDSGSELYLLAEGKVRIAISLKQKEEKAAVHTVTEGQVFGEFSLIDGENRSASAICEKDSRMLVLTRDNLEKLFEQKPHIGYHIMRNFSRILSSRLRKTTRELRASLLWS